MTSRERVIRAMEFRRPDRLPVRYNVNVGSWAKHGGKLEQALRSFFQDDSASACPPPGSAQSVEDDFAWIRPRSFVYGPAGIGRNRDEWGCVWRKLDGDLSVGMVEHHPLADWSQAAHYRWPDPLEYWRFDTPQIEATVEWARARDKFMIVGELSLFEPAQALRGMADLLADIVAEPERAIAIIDRLTEYSLATIGEFARYRPDGFRIIDDWGTQNQLMINPDIWRQLFKPRYKRLIDAVHNLGAKVYWHTDGYTLDIVPDFIELGVDLLHIQAPVMDYETLASLTRRKICLLAEPDRQWLLPRGTPEQVDKEVEKIVRAFAVPEGGLIAHGAIEPDVPIANVEALFRAFERYGNALISQEIQR